MLAPMAMAMAERWQRDAAAVAQALFATPNGPPPDDRVAWLVDDIDHFLQTVGGRSRVVFRLALEAVVRAAPAAALSLRPFSSLPVEARVRALERLERTPLALALFAVKTLLSFHWFEHPDSAVEVGLHANVTALGRHRGSSW